MAQKKVYPAPKFKTLEAEDEYWQTHSPLTEGYAATERRPARTQKRDSFLAVRLSGQEIDRLRQMADRQGVNLSTFVRNVLLRAAKEEEATTRPVTANDLAKALKTLGIKIVEKESPAKKRRVAAVR